MRSRSGCGGSNIREDNQLSSLGVRDKDSQPVSWRGNSWTSERPGSCRQMLTNGLWETNRHLFVMCVDFPGVNTPAVTDFKLPTRCHQTWSQEERCTVSTCEPMQVSPSMWSLPRLIVKQPQSLTNPRVSSLLKPRGQSSWSLTPFLVPFFSEGDGEMPLSL